MDQPERRAELSKAWSDGFSAARQGQPQLSNPHLQRDPLLAREWDQGWKDGTH